MGRSRSRRAFPVIRGNWSAGSYQSVQTELHGKPLRVFLIGFELDRPGGPRQLVAGRQMIADRSTGLALGQELPLGTHGHTVVGLMKNETTSSGDPVGYITLHDAQAPPVRTRSSS